MKKISLLIVMSSIFLVGCLGGKDKPATTPEASDAGIVQNESTETMIRVTDDEAIEQAPEDSLKLESKATAEPTLKNF